MAGSFKIEDKFQRYWNARIIHNIHFLIFGIFFLSRNSHLNMELKTLSLGISNLHILWLFFQIWHIDERDSAGAVGGSWVVQQIFL